MVIASSPPVQTFATQVIDRDGADEDRADDDVVVVGWYVGDDQSVVHRREQQRAERHTGNGSEAAEQAHAAEEHGGDDVEGRRRAAGLHLAGPDARGVDDPGQGPGSAGDRVEGEVESYDAQAVLGRGLAVAAEGANVDPEP